jgi:hypothetical protein
MREYLFLIMMLTFFPGVLRAQEKQFIVKRTPFSSGLNDEFSPVYYKGGLVFCSNLRSNSLIGYKQEQNRLYKIFYIANKDSTGWKIPKLFSKELTSDFNDGPATFNQNGTVIYYSRNNSISNLLRDINDPSNKLGIYSAQLINGIWTNIKPFEYNDPLYSFCTPSLTPDGSRIYFSSDMPGGYGEMDLYYCDWNGNGWGKPNNLGPVINTPENESFPFAGNWGKLYFASSGHQGFGGKDLFYTSEINGNWINPVHLDSAINSPADDFGIVTDSTFEKGYFSSNRLKTDDIFSFSIAPPEFKSCDTIRENNYCFTFFDERHQLIDTLAVTYIWDFGNGIIRKGVEVKHCFPGPGKYTIRLNIVDDLTGNLIADQVEYKADLREIDQGYINSYNVGIAGKPVSFDAARSNLKGFKITDFVWNFGDGFKPGAQYMNKVFKAKGEYGVQLGLIGAKDSLGIIPQKCVSKRIRIFDSYQEPDLKSKSRNAARTGKSDSLGAVHKSMQIRTILMDNLTERQKTKIKALISASTQRVVTFDESGIIPSSFSWLDMIVEVMKEMPDIMLEIAVHSLNDESSGSIITSEQCAQELKFFLKNRDIRMDSFHSKGFGSSISVFGPVVADDKSVEGTIEFIFMKN